MVTGFERYVDWIVRHRVLVVVFTLTVTAFFASQLPALHVKIDPDASLPQDRPYIQALHVLEHTFGEKNLIVIGLFPKDGTIYRAPFLAKLQTITRRVGVDAERDGTFDVYFGGTVALNAGLARITEKTVTLFPIALVMIALLHYEAFRTKQGCCRS